MLYESVIEIDARYDAGGNELKSVDESQVRQDLQAVYDLGIKSCAIVLMHGYRYTKHELQVAEIARENWFYPNICVPSGKPIDKISQSRRYYRS